MEARSGVYCIENTVNGKKYIGQGTNVKRRMWAKHTKCTVLQNSIKKHGRKSFKRYVILYCEAFELNRLEIECIKIYHSLVGEWGYNIIPGGWFGKRGMKASPEAIEKNRLGHIGLHPSDETRKLMSESKTGEKHSLWETHRSDETKKKISEANSGKNNYWFGRKSKNATSQYYGVGKWTQGGYCYWRARIKINGKINSIGYYKTEECAAHSYDKYVIENNLVNHKLNFPENYK